LDYRLNFEAGINDSLIIEILTPMIGRDFESGAGLYCSSNAQALKEL